MSGDAAFRAPEIALSLANARTLVGLAAREWAASERARVAFLALAATGEPMRGEIAHWLGKSAPLLDDGAWADPLRETIRAFSR